MTEPLIVTLRMDEGAFMRLDALRRAHFPPARNHIPAHITAFHHLPGTEIDRIAEDLGEVCAGTAPFPMLADKVRFLGRGVAIDVRSEALQTLRAGLAARWSAWLTAQDRQSFRPHVTIQNKTAPAEARALYERLQTGFVPFPIEGLGVCLWRYQGGPWQPVADFAFGSASDPV